MLAKLKSGLEINVTIIIIKLLDRKVDLDNYKWFHFHFYSLSKDCSTECSTPFFWEGSPLDFGAWPWGFVFIQPLVWPGADVRRGGVMHSGLSRPHQPWQTMP